MEIRYAYGTKTKKWHAITPEDRDWNAAMTLEQIEYLGENEAIKQFLSPIVLDLA